MDVVSLDHVGPVHVGGVSWNVLVIIDHATRYMLARAVPSLEAAQTLRTFYHYWVVAFGTPRAVLTDGGSIFKGAFHTTVTKHLGCPHLVTAPYRPQRNGITEASHVELKNMLHAMWHEGQ
ncbi:integrase core domain protein [Gregarina niphandrodes]|uniref:Integrase core domain protein n=1 Tax=Gregarina niphandrodes TaxID=110365 RepID=A0A023AY31_GRENI|nr:integrase core domain protein [Gregarina niphandrodes]EZG43557.1 integrase core domain protein [Gregarina niphandrodes]|eukprot:XP_011133211.1 integrase core domain protein [Gregarina niphandrodes]